MGNSTVDAAFQAAQVSELQANVSTIVAALVVVSLVFVANRYLNRSLKALTSEKDW